jgi:hypothetical protein
MPSRPILQGASSDKASLQGKAGDDRFAARRLGTRAISCSYYREIAGEEGNDVT